MRDLFSAYMYVCASIMRLVVYAKQLAGTCTLYISVRELSISYCMPKRYVAGLFHPRGRAE